MNAVTNIVYRAAHGASVVGLLLGLFACAGQPTETQMPSAGETTTIAEDAEQVPIQVQSARERAAENARNCRSPAGARIECDADGMNRVLNQVMLPTSID
jgi:hypothetical protein